MQVESLSTFGLIVIVGILIESIINIVKNIQERETSWKYWASLALGILISVLVAVNWDLDLFRLVGLPEGRLPFVGAVLTGLVLSRGSNVINDLIKLIQV